tara:strand:+ start:2027 stop:2293 length:267 start_codon:yes stop_codon:yes gene_type:complete
MQGHKEDIGNQDEEIIASALSGTAASAMMSQHSEAPVRNYYNIASFKHFAIPNGPSTTKHQKGKSMSIPNNSSLYVSVNKEFKQRNHV